jgi:hypothetical protein
MAIYATGSSAYAIGSLQTTELSLAQVACRLYDFVGLAVFS